MENKRLSTLLKLIANPERMAIMMQLLESDSSINELSEAIGLPPTIISTHLHRLRSEGLVEFTRYHRIIEYRLASEEAKSVLQALRSVQTKHAA